MIKILFYLCTGLTAFCIGSLPGYFLGSSRVRTESGDVSNHSDKHFRSCQVKQVKANGRIVWMSCEEWRKTESRDF